MVSILILFFLGTKKQHGFEVVVWIQTCSLAMGPLLNTVGQMNFCTFTVQQSLHCVFLSINKMSTNTLGSKIDLDLKYV